MADIRCRNTQTLLAALDKQIADVRARAAAEAEQTAVFNQTLNERYLEARKENAKKAGKEKASAEGFGYPFGDRKGRSE